MIDKEFFSDTNLVLGFFIILHIVLAIWAQISILKSNSLDNRQKWMNSILTWLIPFLWGMLVRKVIKRTDQDTMIKTKRKLIQNQSVGSSTVIGSDMGS